MCEFRRKWEDLLHRWWRELPVWLPVSVSVQCEEGGCNYIPTSCVRMCVHKSARRRPCTYFLVPIVMGMTTLRVCLWSLEVTRITLVVNEEITMVFQHPGLQGICKLHLLASSPSAHCIREHSKGILPLQLIWGLTNLIFGTCVHGAYWWPPRALRRSAEQY